MAFDINENRIEGFLDELYNIDAAFGDQFRQSGLDLFSFLDVHEFSESRIENPLLESIPNIASRTADSVPSIIRGTRKLAQGRQKKRQIKSFTERAQLGVDDLIRARRHATTRILSGSTARPALRFRG